MIIRITVHDNDFQEVLERFAKVMYYKLYWAENRPDNIDPITWYETAIKEEHTIQDILNADREVTAEEKKILISKLKRKWSEWIDAQRWNKSTTADYLKRHFNASISYTFKDRWQNGEVLYYFTSSNKYILQ